jgi:DNA polymerase-3 subunit gamma/tau
MEDSHYTVLARRFRPQTFVEVVGQQHVSQALQNAIQGGRVAHAYLFTGVRGVGKTSMARILAKSLNCPDAQDGGPCNACEICEGISAGNDVDVMEIDGASNRGIDDVRLLRSNVNVKSMRTKYKIYIIDEVHMLTKEAFNALLKTLEEPPPNVKFIFCTTEPNKLPDTILSRCQRFDFATIETSSIIGRLQEIVGAEGFTVDPAALELVARRAAGSMRDSQSLLDQVLAFGEDRITADDVHRLLGTAVDERLIEMLDALIQRRRDSVLELFDRALADGVQLDELVDQLLNYFRDLMVLAAGAESVTLMSVSLDHRGKLAEQAEQWGLQTIVAALQILAETKTRMFRVSFGRALTELALIRIALLEELDRLEDMIQGLKSGSDFSGSGQPQSPQKKSTRSRASLGAGGGSKATPNRGNAEKKTINGDDLGQQVATTAPQKISHVKFQKGCERELWSQVVSLINDMLKDHVKAISNVAISGPNHLELAFPRSYHFSKQYCERPEVLGRLETLAEKVTGQPIRIAFRLVEEEPDAQVKSTSNREALDSRSASRHEPVTNLFVEQVKSVFGAKVIDIKEISSHLPERE